MAAVLEWYDLSRVGDANPAWSIYKSKTDAVLLTPGLVLG